MDVGLEFDYFLYDIFDNTPDEHEAIEDAIRKAAANDKRLTINRISYSQAMNTVSCDFGLTDKGRAHCDRVAKERCWNNLSPGQKADEVIGNTIEYGCGCLYMLPVVGGLLLFLLFVIAACAQMG